MTRDSDRRKIRQVYDRNSRRVNTMADRRDSRGGRDAAPRRFVVSERVSRRAGFGEGRRQVSGRFASRFADRNVTRKSGRDRFDRNDDNDRKERRLRRRDRNDRDTNTNSGGNRFRRNNTNGAPARRRAAPRKGDNQKDRKNQPKKDSKKKDNKKKDEGPKTSADLDAQLEAYRTGQSVAQVLAARATNQVNGTAALDAQLEQYRSA
jgi:hypothetical protein